MKKTIPKTVPFVLLFVSLLFPGCIKKIMINRIAGALEKSGNTVFTGDNDPRLVADALPFMLKTIESLVEQAPDNHSLLLAAGRTFTLYAFALVEIPSTISGLPADKETQQRRARALFLRGRDYAFAALDRRHPGLSSRITGGATDSALQSTDPADTAALYWAGLAWAGALTSGPKGLGTLLALPKAAAILKKVTEFNDGYGNGAAHDFFISYYAAVPASLGGGEPSARIHFEKAITHSKGARAAPYVALAESVCAKKGYRGEFVELLEKALSIPVDEPDDTRLANIIYQQKARRLLDNTDSIFSAEHQ